MKSSIAQACSAGTSLVCMAQMGAAAAAGGAAMGAMSAAATGSVPFITLVFQALGLSFLLTIPAVVFQGLLVVVLVFTTVSSFISYRLHRRLALLGLTVVGTALLYGSIYILVSEPLYWVAFALMLASAVWSAVIERKPAMRPAKA